MEVTKNLKTEEHPRHEVYLQWLLSANFDVGENIKILVDDVEKLNYTFANAHRRSMSVKINDRSMAKRPLTIDEQNQAIDEFYDNHPELFP